jgi:HlyD family secretion protein
MRKHVPLIFAVIVAAAITIVALRPTTMEVDVAAVTRGRLQVTVDENGETRVLDRFIVAAPLSGRVQRIELEPGARVNRGSVVATIAPSASPLIDSRMHAELAAAAAAASTAVGQATAERERAAALLERTETTLHRQETLVQAGAISRDELDATRTAMKSAQSVLRAAEFAVARAERERDVATARLRTPAARGSAIEVRAPVDGVVLRRLHESEAVVPSGEPLLEIGDPQRLEIVADLLSTDAVRVAAGDAVEIDRWGGQGVLQGCVRRVEPSGFTKISALGVEEQRVNVIIDFADAGTAARALGDGYRVEVRITTWDRPDVLKIPLGSLFRRGSDWAVFAVRDGRVRVQEIVVGQRNGEDAEILRGLSEGEFVVVFPPDTLADNSRVTMRKR